MIGNSPRSTRSFKASLRSPKASEQIARSWDSRVDDDMNGEQAAMETNGMKVELLGTVELGRLAGPHAHFEYQQFGWAAPWSALLRSA